MAGMHPQRPLRTALVTGSSRGIGKAIALRLAHDGYDVAVNDIPANSQGADETVEEITATTGRKAKSIIADVTKRSEVESMVQQSVEVLGPLNLMVANAGIAQAKNVLELSEDEVERIFSVNLYGVFNCYQAAAKQFIKQETKGKIVGAASIAGFRAFPLLSHYSASKFAVRGLTQAFALELARHKITVNAYAPGIVDTKMWDEIDEKMGEVLGVAKGDALDKYSGIIPMGRMSVPDDVAKTVSFLASDDSDYMTGQTLLIDGGILFS